MVIVLKSFRKKSSLHLVQVDTLRTGLSVAVASPTDAAVHSKQSLGQAIHLPLLNT